MNPKPNPKAINSALISTAFMEVYLWGAVMLLLDETTHPFRDG